MRSCCDCDRFQSTLPRRERRGKNFDMSKIIEFQSTLPRRERHRFAEDGYSDRLFQSTLPRRERRRSGTWQRRKELFQSTLPRRERLAPQEPLSFLLCHFNPRSREGSDPTFAVHNTRIKNFNPRSREGSDVNGGVIFSLEGAFQSTLPRRERRIVASDSKSATIISIHAPAKGATSPRYSFLPGLSYFNPRSREGSDAFPYCPFPIKKRFQSTLPRRERR